MANKNFEPELRKLISRVLRENINYKFPITKSKLETHVNIELQYFNQEIKKLTSENNYPFIEYYLKKALEEMNDSIKSGVIHADGMDEIQWAS